MEEPLTGRQARPQTPDPPGRVLVVDDDPAVADVVRRYLVRDGHAVECVRRLREKLEPDPTFPERILTVWGVGYRYEPEVA